MKKISKSCCVLLRLSPIIPFLSLLFFVACVNTQKNNVMVIGNYRHLILLDDNKLLENIENKDNYFSNLMISDSCDACYERSRIDDVFVYQDTSKRWQQLYRHCDMKHMYIDSVRHHLGENMSLYMYLKDQIDSAEVFYDHIEKNISYAYYHIFSNPKVTGIVNLNDTVRILSHEELVQYILELQQSLSSENRCKPNDFPPPLQGVYAEKYQVYLNEDDSSPPNFHQGEGRYMEGLFISIDDNNCIFARYPGGRTFFYNRKYILYSPEFDVLELYFNANYHERK